jgi:hypothetical protein
MDEMDLVKQLKDVSPLRPEAYERARATLGTAMAQSTTVPKPELVVRTNPKPRKRFPWARVGIGTVGAVAAAVAVVSITPGLQPPPAPIEPTTQSPVVDSRLVTLAAAVKASGASLPGDASLVIRTQTTPDKTPYVTYNLYTDSGEVYVTDTGSQLSGAIARKDNLAEATDTRVMAAARQAASGDLDKAREQMVNATPNRWGLGLSPAEAQKAWDEAQIERRLILLEKGVANPSLLPRPTGKALQDGINNSLWTNTLHALAVGAANPEVRAGVLRLISTIADVTVEKSTTDGQPTLILTAGPALFEGDGEHILTINADTGLPIRSEIKPAPGQKDPLPPSIETYKSSRVTVADIVAGKF